MIIVPRQVRILEVDRIRATRDFRRELVLPSYRESQSTKWDSNPSKSDSDPKWIRIPSRLRSCLVARVAQSVEHWSNKPTVAGSIPVVSKQENVDSKLVSGGEGSMV